MFLYDKVPLHTEKNVSKRPDFASWCPRLHVDSSAAWGKAGADMLSER